LKEEKEQARKEIFNLKLTLMRTEEKLQMMERKGQITCSNPSDWVSGINTIVFREKPLLKLEIVFSD